MGRVLASIIDDNIGWHDTICGVSDANMIAAQYGASSYQTHRNDMFRSGKDGLLIELAKHGLGKRDLTASVNFSKVTPDEAGNLSFVANNSKAGSTVDIRFDMNVLLVLSAAPHPLDPKLATSQPAWSFLHIMQALLLVMIFAAIAACKMAVVLWIQKDTIYDDRKSARPEKRGA